jgi:hypothetical protein
MIKTLQYDNLLKSSFLLWLKHNMLTGLGAFENSSSILYNVEDQYQSNYTLATPYKNLIADESIPGATVMSGVYIDGTFTTKGNSNFVDINFDQGQAIFSADPSATISGDYSVQDFDIKLTSRSEESILFESHFKLKNQSTSQQIASTGLQPNEEPYPAIFVMDTSTTNMPIAFGGHEETETRMRCMVLADSLFAADAVKSMLRDKVRTCFPVFSESDFPFNAWGGLITSYNYTGLSATKSHADMTFVSDVKVSTIDPTNVTTDNSDVHVVIIDLDLKDFRLPRG